MSAGTKVSSSGEAGFAAFLKAANTAGGAGGALDASQSATQQDNFAGEHFFHSIYHERILL